jgi:hypothetical protein
MPKGVKRDLTGLSPEEVAKIEKKRAQARARRAKRLSDPDRHEAEKARDRARYVENRTTKLAQNKAYRVANKETILVQRKAHYEQNKEAVDARNKAYYEQNKDAVSAYKKAWAEKHAPSISARKKGMWREHISPVTERILTTFSLLKTDEARRQYADWILFLSNCRGQTAVNHAVIRNTEVDHFLADYGPDNGIANPMIAEDLNYAAA